MEDYNITEEEVRTQIQQQYELFEKLKKIKSNNEEHK